MTTRAFAQKHLFSPLKIVIRDWERDPKGYYIGGMRMYFSARDLARFGQLYLRGGQLDGRQIIPADWVEEVTYGPILSSPALGRLTGYQLRIPVVGGIPFGKMVLPGAGLWGSNYPGLPGAGLDRGSHFTFQCG